MKRVLTLLAVALFTTIILLCSVGCSERTTDPVCTHTFGEWSFLTVPTCITQGERKRVCTLCGSTEVETMSFGDHSGEWTTISPASCTVGGVEHCKCTLCGEEVYRNVEALGHEGTWETVLASTCTQMGSRRIDCTRCRQTVTERTEALGHDYGDWIVAKEATCLKGDEQVVCARCSVVKHKEIPADYSKHSFADGVCTLCGERTATEGLQYELTDERTLAVVGYVGTETEVQIPSYHSGLVVTEIREDAFKNKSEIISLMIPRSVVTIADGCLSGCSSLETLTLSHMEPKLNYSLWRSWNPIGDLFGYEEYAGGIVVNHGDSDDGLLKDGGPYYCCIPASLRSVTVLGGIIPERAFYACTMLTEVILSSDVTRISSEAFVGCTGLTSITIPDGVTSIENGTFSGCTGLTSITIPYGVTNLSGFSYCTGLTSITIPDSVTSIGSSAFEGCTVLTSITIPDSVVSIGSYAFSTCTGLTSITIPDGVTSIENGTFFGCTGLTSITIPDSVTSIGSSAFEGCTVLTSITIPYGVTNLSGFSYCTGLTSITIPDSVTSIGSSAFYGCTGLTSITFQGTKSQWNSIVKGDDWDYSTNDYTIRCKDGDLAKGWNRS